MAEFEQVGLGQWFRDLTGVLELTGALLLIRRPTVFFGAGLLTLVSIGDFFAQVFALHGDMSRSSSSERWDGRAWLRPGQAGT